ncbi:MAG: PaaI family thioesterase [Alphaproteobacteria bacterium]
MDGRKPIIELRICPHHCNYKGTAHGGLLATLADISLGKSAGWGQEPRIPLVTTSLTVNYLGASRLNDWISAGTDFH